METESRVGDRGAGRRWVLIETGGNQPYIFGSNRLRHVIGASQLVHEVGTAWVRTAADRLGLAPESSVLAVSGKALLLVDSAQTGRELIREVTGRALREAPGLRVTGVVGPAFDPTDDSAHEPARAETYRRHAAVRAARPDPLVRDRVFPWHRLCRDSGRPAAKMEVYGEGEEPVPASAGMLARSQARNRAQRRLREKLGERLAAVVPAHLDVLRHSGWVAVVHADGNGVGRIFHRFNEHVARLEGVEQASLARNTQYQRAVSVELETATWQAVRDAVATLAGGRADEDISGRLLPIVVGGDDVTVACDAALAVPFVRAYAAAFAQRTAAQPQLSAITEVATDHAGLTASAGIAVVKPHHPFATAYGLADALTVSAKRFTVAGRPLAAFDLHVAHTSTLRELAELREYVHLDDGTAVARHAGPYLLDPVEQLPPERGHRSVELLDEVDRALDSDGWLSGAQAHALREAADRSLAEYRRQLALLVSRVPDPERARELLSVQSDGASTEDVHSTDQRFLRLFDALHLRGLRLEAPARSTTGTEPIHIGGAR